MRTIETISEKPYFMGNDRYGMPVFDKKDYEERISLLAEKMRKDGLTHVIVYGDREHFANMEYLTGYDPRFEESLLVISDKGRLTLLMGNEGWAYSFISPLDLNRVLYQNFSLQGQPRDRLEDLKDILRGCGMDGNSLVGVVGFKYFDSVHMKDSLHRVDIPSYIVDELCEIVARERITNFTQSMTHLSEGIRMTVRNAKEIAHYEYACGKVSNCMINMLKGLRPGISELEASINAGYDASPISMFPIVNFGEENVRLGLRSPGCRELQRGDLITLGYGIRGSLTARSGLAVYDASDIPGGMEGVVDEFYKPYFEAIVEWYESLRIGANCGEIFDRVMAVIGDCDRFGVALNPGHNTGSDEWTNSAFFKGSRFNLKDGYYLQCDIIASAGTPLRQAILEDGVIIAGEKLRMELKETYPEVYDRINRRRAYMNDVIGIRLCDDVLPLSNCQAVFHPYMLDTGRIFAIHRN